MRIHAKQARAGSVLLLSLWALLVLSVAVFGLAKYVNQEIGTMRDDNLALDAKALAHSGVVVALNKNVTVKTPALVASFGQDRGYHVRMVGEGGRMNLNALLAGEDPARLTLLKNYLASRGLKFDQIQKLVDCMLDWVDPDNVRHLSGAEDEGDYHPPNRPFQSLNEVALVKNSGPLVSQPNWQEDFTLIEGVNQVDLQWASARVISCLPGVGAVRAKLLVNVRQGRDQMDGTRDDHVFKDVNEALSFLGISGQAPNGIAGLVAVNIPVWRIISVGTSGKVDRQVEVVAQSREGPNSKIVLWKEN